MISLILGVFLILAGSFGLGVAKRWRVSGHDMTCGVGRRSRAAVHASRFAGVPLRAASFLCIVAGLATAFV